MSVTDELVLYSYWRSSASYRVRLALALKSLPHRIEPIHLTEGGGQQHEVTYRSLNPQGLVPTLIHGDRVLTQSLAIIEYIDEQFPQTPLLPNSAEGRAKVRALSLVIASDIAPLANLRVLNRLSETCQAGDDDRQAWAKYWIQMGLEAFEQSLSTIHPNPERAQFCWGNEPSMADCCLLPQVYNAQRFGCDLNPMPTIRAICAHLGHNERIESAKPENQPDAPKQPKN